MKKTLTRILSLVLALITVCGLMIAPASAASGISVTDSASTVTVDTGGGKFVVVKTDSAKLRTKASWYGSTYATVTKGSLLLTNGKSDDYYKVKMGGVNYYIHKNDVKAAGNTFKATIDYTTINSAAFRTGPAQKCSIAYKPAKGTAFLTVGTLRNSSNNLWVIVYNPANRSLSYLFSGNCACVCANVKLTVTAPADSVSIRGTLQLKASCSPAVTNAITWTSSNPYVATVNGSGLVTGITAGTTTVTATLNGLNGTVSVSTTVTVTPQVYLDVPVLRQYDSRWKNKYIAQSSAKIGLYGCTLTSVSMLYSYQTKTIYTPDVVDDMLKFTGGGAVYWDSVTNLTNYKRYWSCSLSTIYDQLKQGKPVIVGGNASNGNTHWVIITGYNGDGVHLYASNFLINDPGNSNRTNLQHFLNDFPSGLSTLY